MNPGGGELSRAHHGRGVVIRSAIVLLGMNLFVIILSGVVYQVGNSAQQLVRFFICAVFCILMVMGRSWARWLVVILYAGSGIGAILTGASAMAEGGVGIPLLALGMAYLTPVLQLAFSPSVKRFFTSRRERASGKPASCQVSFDLAGWNDIQRDEETTTWSNEYGDVLSLSVNAGAGDIDVSDSEEVMRFAREFVASQGGGVVSINIVFLDSHRAIEIIFKTEHGTGYTYRGGFFCPLENTLVTVYAIFSEHGTTGVREAVVTASLAESGELELDFPDDSDGAESGTIKGWFFDPYDPEFDGVTLNSISDDIAYDATFPKHPLSAIRRSLESVRESMVIGDELK
jgi:hypothetical protein